MKFETLKDKKYFFYVLIVGVILLITIILATSLAKYKVTESIKLVEGTINYSPSDLNVMAVYLENENGYTQADTIPESGYTLNSKESYCKLNDEILDTMISYDTSTQALSITPITQKGTKCYLYFDIDLISTLIGATWTITEDGEFEVPVTGLYQIEMHGGGGGGVYLYHWSTYYYAGGGGSGEIFTSSYNKDQVISVTIGEGGASHSGDAASSNDGIRLGSSGGTTTFGNLSVSGGGGASADGISESIATPGTASGSLASAGGSYKGSSKSSVFGGQGNINNAAQIYGDGGASGTSSASNGQNGAVIITYLGAE